MATFEQQASMEREEHDHRVYAKRIVQIAHPTSGSINNNYSSAQTNTSIQVTPGANKRIVVTQITFSKDTAGTMLLNEDPSGTPATRFGPHYFPANGGMVAISCYIPLTADKALGITTTGGGNETITVGTIIEEV